MRRMAMACPLIVILALLQGASEEPPLEFDGFTEAYRVVYVAASVDGVVESVAVQRGDEVRRGQVLAKLEGEVEKATLELTQVRSQLQGELEGQEARLEYARRQHAHNAKLHTEGVLSEEELDRSETDTRLAAAAVLKAKENLQLAAVEQKRAEAALELRTVRSPIDGVVIDRFVSPGELVTRVNQSRILGLAQLNPLRVEVFLPGALFGTVASGTEAEVTTDVFPDRRVKAKVKTVDPMIDAASGMFRVRLELLDDDHGLPAGLKCRVRFPR